MSQNDYFALEKVAFQRFQLQGILGQSIENGGQSAAVILE